jgi:hypothetical protein
MQLNKMEDLLKAYFEPVRTRLNNLYLETDGHHARITINAIGWCPQCLQLNEELTRLNGIYGDPRSAAN